MTVIHELHSSLVYSRGPTRLIALSESEIKFLQRMLQHVVEAGVPLSDAKEYIRLHEALQLRLVFAEKIEVDSKQRGEQAYARAKAEENKTEQEAAWAREFEESYHRGHRYSIALQMTDDDIKSSLLLHR